MRAFAVDCLGWAERRTIKASKFSEAQKALILKQGAGGIPVVKIYRKAGISQATYFNWKKKHDGLLPTEMRRLKLLEDENSKLRKLLADLSLDREMLSSFGKQSSRAAWLQMNELISRRERKIYGSMKHYQVWGAARSARLPWGESLFR